MFRRHKCGCITLAVSNCETHITIERCDAETPCLEFTPRAGDYSPEFTPLDTADTLHLIDRLRTLVNDGTKFASIQWLLGVKTLPK